MMFSKRCILIIYAAIASILIWSGAGWIITEFSKIDAPPTAPATERYNQFIMMYGVSMVLIGMYIMMEKIVFRDTVIY